MAEYVYEDGTPVPPELLPPELAEPAAEPPPQESRLGRAAAAYEAAATLGTGLAGYGAGAAAGLASLPYHVARGLAHPSIRPEEEARRTRQRVQQALTYMPRTEGGLRTVGNVAERLERNPFMNPQLTQRIEQGVGETLSPEAGEMAGLIAHPLNLLGVAPVRAGISAGVRGAAGALARSGQRAAVRTLGAPQGVAGGMALMRGRAGMEELGRTVQSLPGAQLRRGPAGVMEGPIQRVMAPVGQQLTQVVDEAAQAGASIDLGRVLQRFDAQLGGMAKDPLVAKRVAAVRQYVADTAKERGVWGPEGRMLYRLPTNEAHMMRQGMDDFIYAAMEGLPPKSPLRGTFRKLRRIVDDELGAAVGQALGPEKAGEWARLNARYHNLADVERLAKAGFKRQLGAEYGAPSAMRRRRFFGIPSPFVEGPVRPSYRMQAAHARLTQPLSF